jgi:hypothetical protein
VSPDPESSAERGDTEGVDTDIAATEARSRWEAVLASLEADLGQDGAVPGTGDGTASATPWAQPAGLGPIPRDLVGRASRLLAAQRDRIAVVEDARRSTLDHLGALRAVDATRVPGGSVYLDASA